MKLSIVIPAFNSEETLGICISSIRNSTFDNYKIIVVDDGSTDLTRAKAMTLADSCLIHQTNRGRSAARNTGAIAAEANVVVFIDSDVIVKSNSLTIIAEYFSRYPKVDAITGLLAKEHPNSNYFSQYKNLYMHYTFRQLPERCIAFLYGSIHAIRKHEIIPYGTDVKIADDTALGQRLVEQGKTISFVKELEVIHLKKYSLQSFVLNDFRIPYDWAIIFVRCKGWRQLGKGGTGFAHSSIKQLASITIVPFVLIMGISSSLDSKFIAPTVLLIFTWYILNHKFVQFLKREKGAVFGLLSIPVTFIDHFIMGCGIVTGILASIFYRKTNTVANKVSSDNS